MDEPAPTLHERLTDLQSDEEIDRKAKKASMRKGKLWTQEEVDSYRRRRQRWLSA